MPFMTKPWNLLSRVGALACTLAAISAPALAGDGVTIPKGTTVDLVLEDALSSRTAKVGDTFRARLAQPLEVAGHLALASGTQVEGVVAEVASMADGARSGVIGVKFVRLALPGSDDQRIDAKLISLKQDNRRRFIELAPKVSTGRKQDVVFIGSSSPADGRAHTLVGHDAAEKFARSGLAETEVEIAAGTLVSMEFAESVTVPAAVSTDESGSQPARF